MCMTLQASSVGKGQRIANQRNVSSRIPSQEDAAASQTVG
jgi:hypothetical protein